jgi:hypothetical protein
MSWATVWATFWQTRLVTLFANNPFVTALIKQPFGNGKSSFVSKRFFSRLWRVWLVCPTIKKCRKNRGRRKKVFLSFFWKKIKGLVCNSDVLFLFGIGGYFYNQKVMVTRRYVLLQVGLEREARLLTGAD